MRQHVEKWVPRGDVESFTDGRDDPVALDLLVKMATPERPVQTVVTSGMSQRAMSTAGGERRAELLLVLPEQWPTPSSEAFSESRSRWPYDLLLDLARLPHDYDTYLATGHTIPNGDPPEPYAPGVAFNSALIAPPVLPESLGPLATSLGDIEFLAVWPLWPDELDLKLNEGVDALYGALDDCFVTEWVDPARPSVVAARST